MFNVKRSTKEAFVKPFMFMSRKMVTLDNNYHALELVRLGGKWFNSSHAHHTGFF